MAEITNPLPVVEFEEHDGVFWVKEHSLNEMSTFLKTVDGGRPSSETFYRFFTGVIIPAFEGPPESNVDDGVRGYARVIEDGKAFEVFTNGQLELDEIVDVLSGNAVVCELYFNSWQSPGYYRFDFLLVDIPFSCDD